MQLFPLLLKRMRVYSNSRKESHVFYLVFHGLRETAVFIIAVYRFTGSHRLEAGVSDENLRRRRCMRMHPSFLGNRSMEG